MRHSCPRTVSNCPTTNQARPSPRSAKRGTVARVASRTLPKRSRRVAFGIDAKSARPKERPHAWHRDGVVAGTGLGGVLGALEVVLVGIARAPMMRRQGAPEQLGCPSGS
jgi:hypothetical protein